MTYSGPKMRIEKAAEVHKDRAAAVEALCAFNELVKDLAIKYDMAFSILKLKACCH